jgi:hypothetical protein
MMLGSVAVAQTAHKSLQLTSRLNSQPTSQYSLSNTNWLFDGAVYADDFAYDLLKPNNHQFTYLETQNNLYGQQVMFRMKFADWLSLRLGVYDDNQVNQLFMPVPQQKKTIHHNDLSYQLGVSSVLDISPNWRLGSGFKLTGQVSGDMLGLYQDQLDTTSFGFGVRSQRFGASLHSDYISSQQNNVLYRSSIDLQVDWHFNQDGTLSFGARKKYE